MSRGISSERFNFISDQADGKLEGNNFFLRVKFFDVNAYNCEKG